MSEPITPKGNLLDRFIQRKVQSYAAPVGEVVDKVVKTQLKRHALPLGVAGLGLAGAGYGLGYMSGQNNVYNRIYKDQISSYSNHAYMVDFGHLPSKSIK